MFVTAELGRPLPALGDTVTTGEGAGSYELDPAAGGFELRLIAPRSGGGVAKDGGAAGQCTTTPAHTRRHARSLSPIRSAAAKSLNSLRLASTAPAAVQQKASIPGLVNVDFADVKAVMKNSGTAMLGVGVSSSKNRAQEAAEQATLAPLIGSSIEAATGIVYNITGGKDITLQEVNKVSQVRVAA
ncbi:hypothetical protein ACQ4PT_011016 [Festuca glaucescens]